jgi:hypothetical protein
VVNSPFLCLWAGLAGAGLDLQFYIPAFSSLFIMRRKYDFKKNMRMLGNGKNNAKFSQLSKELKASYI